MADLFKKLNTLVKASLHDLLEGGRSRRAAPPVDPPKDIASVVERDAAAIRQRMTERQSYEASLQARIAALNEEIKAWDAQADAAVARGADDDARHAIDQLRRAERHQIKLINDLREYQELAQQLSDRVDVMESTASQAKAAAPKPEDTAQPAAAPVTDHDLTASTTADSTATENDLERRRQRLSKKD